MAGGGVTSVHNGVRDVFRDFCERAGLRPLNEAPRVLAEVLGRENRLRPADVLCLPALALSCVLPDGPRAVRTEPVCFDFAVINPLGADPWAETAAGSGNAAAGYDQRRRAHLQTEHLCSEAGSRFWPEVFEAQGGMAKAAAEAVWAVAEAVAERERREAASVRHELLARVAVLMARSAVRAIRRRDGPRRGSRPRWAGAIDSICRESVEEDPDM